MNSELAARYQQIMRRINELAGGPGRVTLIAVSKFQPAEAIEALYSLGHRDFGENYAQELAEKAGELASSCPGIRWHFIGHLQTNKVKIVLPYAHAVHSVDSERLARELDKRWRALHGDATPPLPCFLEVNIDREPSKAGVLPEEAPALAASIAAACPLLRLEGLMAIPSAEGGKGGGPFEALRDLEQNCRPATHGKLSMGMSDDFDLAIFSGATHVRIGTALFGPRQTAAET